MQCGQLSNRRQLGKMAVLGLGYQMGATKFWSQLKADPKVLELIRAGCVTETHAEQAVLQFRGQFWCIRRLWGFAEEAFEQAVHTGASDLPACAVRRDGPDLFVQLPSGRRLRYPHVEYALDGDLTYAGNHKLYGGLIVENIVQAIARDVLVEAVLWLEHKGLPVVLHVHDEVVLEVPAESAEAARGAAIEQLSRARDWAPGLPLAAEGRVAACYGK